MPETAAPANRAAPPFNPTWLSFGLSLVISIATLGATYRDVSELREWRKGMEQWKSARDIADAEDRKDMKYIRDKVDEIGNAVKALQSFTDTGTDAMPVRYQRAPRR